MSNVNDLDPFKIDTFAQEIKNSGLNKNMYIEASAGTGKTFTIRKLSAELVRNRIPLSEVLFVTYTEKAAGEMRDRIREEMVECASKATLEEKPLFERACQDIDKAVIGTIHSFCRKTLHDFAYEAEVPFDMENANDQSAEVIIDRLIRDEWEDEICGLKPESNQDRAGLVEYIKKQLKNSIKSYSPEKKPVLPPATAQEWIEQNPEAAKHFQTLSENPDVTFSGRTGDKNYRNKSVKSLIEAMLTSRGSLVNGNKFGSNLVSVNVCSPELVTKVTEALQYFYPLTISLPSEAEIAKLKFLNEKTEVLYKRWQQEKAQQKAQSFNDMIWAVREAVCPGGNAPKEPTALCQKLRKAYQVAIIDEFQDTNRLQWDIFETVFKESDNNHIIVVGDPKQSIYSFQGADLDIYRQATKKIKNGSKLAINYRSSISMIDACNSLFMPDKETKYPFLPEGDFKESYPPKEVKDQRQDALFNGEPTKPIWVSPILNEEGFARFAVQKIIECCKIQDGKTALQIYERGKSEPRNVSFKDFAILGRTRPEMAEIKKCLAKVGIPFLLYKDNSLFNSRECTEWISVLRMLAATNLSGYNGKLLNGVLVTDFFGMDLYSLTDEPLESLDEKKRRQIASWRLFASKRQWAELQEQIYEDTRIEETLSRPSRLQDLAKLRQIGNYIFGYLYEKKATLQQAIKHLETLASNNKNDSEEDQNLVAKGTDFKAVQLMTIHASKGLEFPVVISCAGHNDVNDNVTGPFTFSKEDPEQKKENEDDNNLIKCFGYDKASKANRQQEEFVEWHRLLYVDYTRASSLLILPQYDRWFVSQEDDPSTVTEGIDDVASDSISPSSEEPTNDIRKPGSKFHWAFLAEAHRKICDKGEFATLCQWDDSWDVASLQKTVSEEIVFFNKDDKQDVSDLPSQEIINQIQKSLKNSSLYQHSYSSIDRKSPGTEIESIDGRLLDRAGDEPDDEDLQEINEAPDYPRGNVFGEALHQVLEELDFVRIGGLTFEKAQEDSELRDLITNKFLSQGLPIGNHPNWMTRTVEIVWNTMNASLPEIHGAQKTGNVFSLKTLDFPSRLAEMEFQMDVNKEDCADKPMTFCKGFMDLVFVIEKNGKEYYSVLDWKSNLLQKYDAESTFEAAKTHYSIQMTLYSYCLIMWLCSIKGKEPATVFNEHFGGIYYVFARGCQADKNSGIFAHTWESFEELEKAYTTVRNLMYAKG